MIVEIIKDNPVTVKDKENISSLEAGKLLRMSRQTTSSLMKKFIEKGGEDSIDCIVISGRYYTTESKLKKFYEYKVSKFAAYPKS